MWGGPESIHKAMQELLQSSSWSDWVHSVGRQVGCRQSWGTVVHSGDRSWLS